MMDHEHRDDGGYPHLNSQRVDTRPFEGWPAYWLQHPGSRTVQELKTACRWGDKEIQVLRERVRHLKGQQIHAGAIGFAVALLGILLALAWEGVI